MLLLAIFIISCVATYLLSKLAESIGLLAHPDKHRQHEKSTPLLGGIAIVAGIVLGSILISNEYTNLLPSLLLLCFVGLLDDRFKLPSYVRFLAQASAAYLMIELTGVQLTHLGQLITQETIILGQWSIPLTIFAVIGVINAVNMSDGLDGLAGSLVILVLFSQLAIGSDETALISTSIASILGFLVWNVRLIQPRAKIFMGDAGSTMLGLLVAYCLIKTSQQLAGAFSPVTALWLLALPLFDAVAVLLVRPIRGKSPFSADRIHYHHLLKALGFSVNQVVLIALVIQTVFIGIGFTFEYLGIAQNIQFVTFMVTFIFYFLMLLKRTN